MSYTINRADAKQISVGKHWLLLYGRRKVGKTFMLRELCRYENYYSIKSDLSVMSNKGLMSISEMAAEIKNELSNMCLQIWKY